MGPQVGSFGATSLYGGMFRDDWTGTLRSAAGRQTRGAPTPKDVDPYHPDACAVYRFFNASGGLLYVGIAGDPRARFKGHSDTSVSWWREWAARTVAWYPTRAAAAAEELIAIQEERPAFNKAGAIQQADRLSPRERADFVTDRAAYYDWVGINPFELNALFDIQAQLTTLDLKDARLFADPETSLAVYNAAYERAGRFTRWMHAKHVELFYQRAFCLAKNRHDRLTVEDGVEDFEPHHDLCVGPLAFMADQDDRVQRRALGMFEIWKREYEMQNQ